MSGYFNSHELSDESRILQQSRAFEILLQLPEQGQRKVFKEKVRLYCFPREKKFQIEVRYLSERIGGRREAEKSIMAVMWADRFYVLRNHIIHGDVVRPGSFLFKRQRHGDIALWIYLILVKKIINENLLSPEKFYDEVLWKERRFSYEKGDVYAISQNQLRRSRRGGPRTV